MRAALTALLLRTAAQAQTVAEKATVTPPMDGKPRRGYDRRHDTQATRADIEAQASAALLLTVAAGVYTREACTNPPTDA